MEINEIDLVEIQERRKSNLKKQVRRACNNAITINRGERGIETEFVEDAREFGRYMRENKVLVFPKPSVPHVVYVENTHEYLILVRLALKQMQMMNNGLDEEQLLEKEATVPAYNEWYDTWTEKHLKHEYLEHYMGAMEYTNLKVYFGVEFFKDTTGFLSFRPVTGFEGVVNSQLFYERVAKGLDASSVLDQIILGEAES